MLNSIVFWKQNEKRKISTKIRAKTEMHTGAEVIGTISSNIGVLKFAQRQLPSYEWNSES